MNPFDVTDYKIDPSLLLTQKSPLNIKQEIAEPFLKGPIPLSWLEKASCLGGKALQVGISLWFLKGVTRNNTVNFNQNKQQRFGVKRDAARRALHRLEKSGLISISRSNGRCLTVTLNQLNKNIELVKSEKEESL